jgi:hypothetical protein
MKNSLKIPSSFNRVGNRSIIIIFLLFGFMAIPKKGIACDACGCSLGGFYFGLIPQTNQHFVGARYGYSRFYAEMNHGTGMENSFDTYQRWDFMGRFAISNKWQVNVVLPYVYNTMKGSHESETMNGISDPLAILNYKALDQKMTGSITHSLWLGEGLKFPLASYDHSSFDNMINPNFQLGSGSLDYLFNANYVISRRQIGVNLESVFKLNTSNSEGYRFGNQWNGLVSLFYNKNIKQVSLLPYVGTYLEISQMHTAEGIYQFNTDGKAAFAQLGTQAQFKKLLLNVNYQIPFSQHFNSDAHVQITAKNRLNLTLLYFIQKKSKSEPFKMSPDM